MAVGNKTIFAVVLILLWGGLAIWQWGFLEEPARAPLTNVTGPAASGRQADGRRGGLHVALDLLAATGIRREATFVTPRNVFAGPSAEGTPPSTTDAALVSQEGASSTEGITEQAGAMESGQFRYLGFLRIGEGRERNQDMAVLGKDDEVLVLKVGDRIDNRLVLKAISSERVILRDPGTRVDQTVLLSEEPIERE